MSTDAKVETVPETPEEERAAVESEYFDEQPNTDEGWDEQPAADPQEELVGEEPPELLTETEPEPVAEVPIDQDAEFTNEHFAYGQQMGLSPDQVRSFGNPQAFESVIGTITANTGVDPAKAAVDQQVRADNPDAFQEEAAPVVEGDYSFEDPDLYDDTILGMNQHNNTRFQQMEGRLHNMESMNQRLQADVAAREFDQIVDTLDGELFGVGRLNSLDETTAMNRVKLANEVSRQGHGYEARGEALPPLGDLVAKSYQSVWGGELKERTLRGIAAASKARTAQTTAIPTNRESDPVDSTVAATKAAMDWYRTNGTPIDEEAALIE